MAMNFGTLDFAVAFNRQTAFPLDAKSYFESLELATAAAASAQEAGSSETTYYYGQTIAVVADSKATLYVIQPDKTLKEVGGNIAINENVFVKDSDGTLDLLGFADAVAGAQAVKSSDGKISWVKPDATTVEGLQTAVASLQATVGNENSGLVKQVAENKAAIDTLNGDKTVSGSVAYQIAQIVSDAPEAYDTLKEIATWITTHAGDAATMNANIAQNTSDIEALEALVGSTAVATQIANAIDTALKDGGTDKYALAADLTSLSEEVSGIKLKLGETSVAEQIEAALKVDGAEKYALASHTHEISNVNGLQDILNKKAAAADVEALENTVSGLSAQAHQHTNKTILDAINEEKVAAWDAGQPNVIEIIKANGTALTIDADKSVNIPAATASALGLVRVDDSTIEAVDGVISVKSVGISKVYVEDGTELVLNGGNA